MSSASKSPNHSQTLLIKYYGILGPRRMRQTSGPTEPTFQSVRLVHVHAMQLTALIKKYRNDFIYTSRTLLVIPKHLIIRAAVSEQRSMHQGRTVIWWENARPSAVSFGL